MASDEMTDFSLTSGDTPEITFVYDSLTAPKAAVRYDTKCGDIMTQEITCNVLPIHPSSAMSRPMGPQTPSALPLDWYTSREGLH
jgi:hypothetical protein